VIEPDCFSEVNFEGFPRLLCSFLASPFIEGFKEVCVFAEVGDGFPDESGCGDGFPKLDGGQSASL